MPLDGPDTLAYYPKGAANVALIPGGSGLSPSDLRGETSPDSIIRLANVEPISMRITSTPVNKADTAEVTFEETLFPVDPREIQTISLDLHLGDAHGLDQDIDVDSRRNQIHLGVVDEIEKQFSVDGKSTIHFKSSGYKALLMDAKWQNFRLDISGRPLGEAILEVIDEVPAASGMNVVSEFSQPKTFPPTQSKKRSEFVAKDGASVWEGLTQLARKAGAILTVRQDTIAILPPRTARIGSQPLPLFIPGRNLADLRIRRKYATEDIPNVRVQATDPRTRELVTGQHPRPFRPKKRITKTQQKTEQERTVEIKEFQVRLSNPTRSKLDSIAEQIHAKYEQQQIEIELSTREMEVWKTQSAKIPEERLEKRGRVADVPDIRNGTPIRIWVDRKAQRILSQPTTEEQRARELERAGFASTVASVLAQKSEVARTPIWVSKATHHLQEDGSYKADLRCKNLITVDV